MKSIPTYCFKVKDANPGKVAALRGLAAGRWRKGLNFALQMAKAHRPGSSFALHPGVYRDLRRFGLGAQLACACRDKAFEAWKAHQRLREHDPGRYGFPHFGEVPAIRFNIPRSCRLFTRGDQYWCAVTTPQGWIRLRITGQAKTLARVWGATPSHAELVFKGDRICFHVALSTDVATPSVQERKTFIVVDFNITHHLIVAVAMTAAGKILGTFWIPAGRFNWKRKHFCETRRALQTAGAHHKVKAQKGRERHFVESFLHEATARLIRWASHFPDPFLTLEDLHGIRQRVHASRAGKRKLHSWPFRSGQAMLSYKGLPEGIFSKQLRGAFSSRYCSRCGGRHTRRSGASFACLACGYGLNAHLNGAANMAWRAVRYTQAAAGRAESRTAERQSGPDVGDRDVAPAAQSSLGRHLLPKVSCKPLTPVRGS
jgi:IS605 OrfB family transposase